MKMLLSFVLLQFIVIDAKTQTSQKTNVDSAITVTEDSSQIVIDKSILDKDYWKSVITSQNVSFVNYFRRKDSNIPYYVYISSVEKQAAYEYIFLIYSRPLKIESSSLISFGYATYRVFITKITNSVPKIQDVKLIGPVI